MVHGWSLTGICRGVNSACVRVRAFMAPCLRTLLTRDTGYVLAVAVFTVAGFSAGRAQEQEVSKLRMQLLLAQVQGTKRAAPCSSCKSKKPAVKKPVVLRREPDPVFSAGDKGK
jgi:hypothetical protein